MTEKEHKSVLIVSSSDKIFDAISSSLPLSEFFPVEHAASAALARRKLKENEWDILFINSPLGDESGLDLALHAAEDYYAGVLLLVKEELYDQICYKVESGGVLVLSKPLNRASFHQALMLALATRERLKKAEKKNESLINKMEEIRCVTRAKWLLIEKLGMTESAAHRFIEKQAMDMRQTKREIAETLIRTYDN